MKYLVSALFIVAVGLVSVFSFNDAKAANAADFNPSYIIDDAIFYNGNAMDAGQIQNFLNSKNPNCDYWGTQPAREWGYPNMTRAQFAEHKRNGTNGFSRDAGFHAPPYKCLTMYSQNTPQMEASSGYCSAIGAGNRTAAQIINDVAKACGINPQVLIILLEKEQSLITDIWPLDRQLRNATGFACPDTAPCNPAYEGFFYQVYNAARQFKVYQAFPNSYNYRAGRNNTVYFHPGPFVNGAKQGIGYCGSTQLYIQNQATAALYIYTPYQPNQSALNNLYGTGDICGSYGNRNFWRIFTDWFGSTKVSYQNLDTPRWMVLNRNQVRLVPGSNSAYPDPNNTAIPAGTQLRFVSKIWADNQWYFRTEHNTALGVNVAIPASSVNEIAYVNFDTPRWMTLNQDSQKYVSAGERPFGQAHKAGTNIKFVDKLLVNNQWYFRTEMDKALGQPYGIPASRISEASYVDFDTPRWMNVKDTATKTNPILGQNGSQVNADTQLLFNKKITLSDKTYFQAESDNGTSFAIDSTAIEEIAFQKLTGTESRWLVLNAPTQKVNPFSGELDQKSFPAGTQINFAEKITVNGVTYLRTAFDTNDKTNLAVPMSSLSEINFVALDTPRTMKLKAAQAKIYPKTGEAYPNIHAAGQQIRFTTKIQVNGIWYLRSEFDLNANVELGIPLNQLVEL